MPPVPCAKSMMPPPMRLSHLVFLTINLFLPIFPMYLPSCKNSHRTGREHGQSSSCLNEGKNVLPIQNPSSKNSSVIIVWFVFLIKQFKTTRVFFIILVRNERNPGRNVLAWGIFQPKKKKQRRKRGGNKAQITQRYESH